MGTANRNGTSMWSSYTITSVVHTQEDMRLRDWEVPVVLAPILNLQHDLISGHMIPITVFPAETAIKSNGIGGPGTGNVQVPAKKRTK